MKTKQRTIALFLAIISFLLGYISQLLLNKPQLLFPFDSNTMRLKWIGYNTLFKTHFIGKE